ncbi:hypothetical protein [Escherichia coli]|uniref:hypothetical protein n=1 Tax=Escherichia coli TaxID=562 RepID=UPI003890623F
MKKYTVIDDDIDNKIYAYAMNNAISFSKVINNDIKNDKPVVLTSLAEVQNDLWAYCIKVQKGLTSLILSEKSAGESHNK